MGFSFSEFILGREQLEQKTGRKQKLGFLKCWALYNAGILNKRVVSSVFFAVSFRLLLCAFQRWAEVGTMCILFSTLVLARGTVPGTCWCSVDIQTREATFPCWDFKERSTCSKIIFPCHRYTTPSRKEPLSWCQVDFVTCSVSQTLALPPRKLGH